MEVDIDTGCIDERNPFNFLPVYPAAKVSRYIPGINPVIFYGPQPFQITAIYGIPVF